MSAKEEARIPPLTGQPTDDIVTPRLDFLNLACVCKFRKSSRGVTISSVGCPVSGGIRASSLADISTLAPRDVKPRPGAEVTAPRTSVEVNSELQWRMAGSAASERRI